MKIFVKVLELGSTEKPGKLNGQIFFQTHGLKIDAFEVVLTLTVFHCSPSICFLVSDNSDNKNSTSDQTTQVDFPYTGSGKVNVS